MRNNQDVMSDDTQPLRDDSNEWPQIDPRVTNEELQRFVVRLSALSEQGGESNWANDLGLAVIVAVTGVIVAVGVVLVTIGGSNETEQILIGLIAPAIVSLVGAGLGGFVRRVSRIEAGPVTVSLRHAGAELPEPNRPDPLRDFVDARTRTQRALIQASQDPGLVSPAEYKTYERA
jgi:hypothetical protein